MLDGGDLRHLNGWRREPIGIGAAQRDPLARLKTRRPAIECDVGVARAQGVFAWPAWQVDPFACGEDRGAAGRQAGKARVAVEVDAQGAHAYGEFGQRCFDSVVDSVDAPVAAVTQGDKAVGRDVAEDAVEIDRVGRAIEHFERAVGPFAIGQPLVWPGLKANDLEAS